MTGVRQKSAVTSRRVDISYDDARTNEEPASRDQANRRPVDDNTCSRDLSTAEDRLLLSPKERTHVMNSAEDRLFPSAKEKTMGKRVRFKPDRLKVTMTSGQSYV